MVDFDPRRAKPNETFEFADAGGTLHSFSADEEGIVHPRNDLEVAVLDARAAPVARKVRQATKAKKAKTDRADTGKES